MSAKSTLTRAAKAKGDRAAIAGDLDEAEQSFAGACRRDPSDVEAWVKLSLVQKRRGRFDEAEASAGRALRLSPRLGYAHHAHAVALHARGRLDEAADAYRRAIALQPGFADPHFLIGCLLRAQGRPAEAAAAFQRTLRLQPDHAEAMAEIGAQHVMAGDHLTGADWLRRALRLQPTNVVAQCNLAQALRAAGRDAEALQLYESAVALAPDSIEAIAGLAGHLEKVGRTDAAASWVERGRAIAADDVPLLIVAAQLARRSRRFDEAVDLLQQALTRPLPLEQAAEVEKLLGLTYDQLQRADLAMPMILSGNQKRRALFSLAGSADPARYLAGVQRFVRLATPALAAAPPVPPPTAGEPEDPVFVIGFPRSGTTLLEQVLDSHPGLQAMEERPAAAVLVEACLAQLDGTPDALAHLDAAALASLRQRYFEQVRSEVALAPGVRLVDKLPLNTVRVPVLWRVFPRAKFVLALRHPCDVVLSCLMQDFTINDAMAAYCSLEDTARQYDAVMSAWRSFAAQLPLGWQHLRYEDLVDDVEGQARRLIGFLGLPWRDEVLQHTEHARRRGAINTPSYQQVVQPIYRSAVQRWRRYEAALQPVLPLLQRHIEVFGYGAEAAAPSSARA